MALLKVVEDFALQARGINLRRCILYRLKRRRHQLNTIFFCEPSVPSYCCGESFSDAPPSFETNLKSATKSFNAIAFD